jgi:hypothetical protein
MPIIQGILGSSHRTIITATNGTVFAAPDGYTYVVFTTPGSGNIAVSGSATFEWLIT